MIALVAGVSLLSGMLGGQYTVMVWIRQRYSIPHEVTFWDWLDDKLK